MNVSRFPFPFLALAAVSFPVLAQTVAPKAAPHRPTATPVAHKATTSTQACSAHPEVTAKVPALPAGVSCPKPLFIISTVPSVRLDYVLPGEENAIRSLLGIESSTIQMDYVDTKMGTGEAAAPNKWYTVHYTGYLVDGTKFDSSVDRNEPFNFHNGQHQVIAGWDAGFAGMHVGGKRRLYIPFQLAYGPNGRQPTIPARAELIFDMELISQSDQPPAPKTPPAPPQPASPPAGAPGGATSPAGAGAPPPTTSATPASSTAPAPSTAPRPQ